MYLREEEKEIGGDRKSKLPSVGSLVHSPNACNGWFTKAESRSSTGVSFVGGKDSTTYTITTASQGLY